MAEIPASFDADELRKVLHRPALSDIANLTNNVVDEERKRRKKVETEKDVAESLYTTAYMEKEALRIRTIKALDLLKKKLAATEQALADANVRIAQLEQHQAAHTEKYYAESNELFAQVRELEESLTSSQQMMTDQMDMYNAIMDERSRLTDRVTELEALIGDKEELLKLLQASEATMKATISTQNDEAVVLHQRIDTLEALLNESMTKEQADQTTIADLQTRLDSSNMALVDQASHHSAELTAQKTMYDELIAAEAAKLEQVWIANTVSIAQWEEEKASLKATICSYERQTMEHETMTMQWDTELNNLAIRLQSSNDDYASLTKEVEGYERTIFEQEAKLAAQEQTLFERAANGRVLESMARELESFQAEWEREKAELECDKKTALAKYEACQAEWELEKEVSIKEFTEELERVKTLLMDHQTQAEMTTATLQVQLLTEQTRLAEMTTAHETIKQSHKTNMSAINHRISLLKNKLGNMVQKYGELRTKNAILSTEMTIAHRRQEQSEKRHDDIKAMKNREIEDLTGTKKLNLCEVRQLSPISFFFPPPPPPLLFSTLPYLMIVKSNTKRWNPLTNPNAKKRHKQV